MTTSDIAINNYDGVYEYDHDIDDDDNNNDDDHRVHNKYFYSTIEIINYRLNLSLYAYIFYIICCFFLFIFFLIIKGASYKQIYQHIEDWRHIMSYFMIESHRLCYRLLSTLQHDVIGR